MSIPGTTQTTRTRPIRHLRWYIGGLLFLSTVINYIDRQTLSVLAPYLQVEFNWSNEDFALVIIAFRVAYTLGQAVAGRLLDVVGTRTGLRSFAAFRFLLGAGEAANWPGATKAVSEWFPKSERGLAVAIFDSGSAVGGAIAPVLVIWLYSAFGSWRPAFVITGLLGLLWLCLFRMIYRRPEEHPRLSDEERRMILEGRATAGQDAPSQRLSYRTLLRQRQTWGIILGKSLSDPVWFFVTDWFAIYLVSRGHRIEESLLAFWVPFLAADLGNFAGGGLSSYLIKRGWPVGRARKAVVVLGGLGMTLIGATVLLPSFGWLVACFAIATFSYAALSTMVLNLPADIYPTGSVASVSGLSGMGAGIGTITATYLTGYVSTRYSFEPVLIGASLVPLVGMVAVLLLVRNTRATREGVLAPI